MALPTEGERRGKWGRIKAGWLCSYLCALCNVRAYYVFGAAYTLQEREAATLCEICVADKFLAKGS